MAINIKSEEVCALVRRTAAATGLTQVQVIERAVTGFAAQQAHQTGRDRVGEILAEFDARLTDADRHAMRHTMEDLYDEQGLPT